LLAKLSLNKNKFLSRFSGLDEEELSSLIGDHPVDPAGFQEPTVQSGVNGDGQSAESSESATNQHVADEQAADEQAAVVVEQVADEQAADGHAADVPSAVAGNESVSQEVFLSVPSAVADVGPTNPECEVRQTIQFLLPASDAAAAESPDVSGAVVIDVDDFGAALQEGQVLYLQLEPVQREASATNPRAEDSGTAEDFETPGPAGNSARRITGSPAPKTNSPRRALILSSVSSSQKISSPSKGYTSAYLHLSQFTKLTNFYPGFEYLPVVLGVFISFAVIVLLYF
jgi:hypothetical protein